MMNLQVKDFVEVKDKAATILLDVRTPEEFADWGQDNSYIDGVVATHLGVIII